MKESQRDKPRCSSQIDLYQNCTKTLCNCTLGAYFEREADSPKLLKTLKRRTKEGIFGRDERACKAGALPTELHAHCGDWVHSKAFPLIPKCLLAFSMISVPKLCGACASRHFRARHSSKVLIPVGAILRPRRRKLISLHGLLYSHCM